MWWRNSQLHRIGTSIERLEHNVEWFHYNQIIF